MPIYCTDEELKFIYDNLDKMKMKDIALAIGKSYLCIWKHKHSVCNIDFIQKRNKGAKRKTSQKRKKSKVIRMSRSKYFDSKNFKVATI